MHFNELSTPKIPSPVDSKTSESFLLVFRELMKERVTREKSKLINIPERRTITGLSDSNDAINFGSAVNFSVHVFPYRLRMLIPVNDSSGTVAYKESLLYIRFLGIVSIPS